MDNILILMFIVVLVVGLALFAYIATAGKSRSKLDRAYYQNHWKRIETLTGQGASGGQLAVLEADKLLDQALKASGYPGATMGDRLKDARRAFRDLDGVWQAHKLRNRLAHENDIRLNTIVVNRALKQFKSGLKDLGAL